MADPIKAHQVEGEHLIAVERWECDRCQVMFIAPSKTEPSRCPNCGVKFEQWERHHYSKCVYLRKNLLGYWIITREDNPNMAWSGSTWVPVAGNVQVANFKGRGEAREYAKTFGFTVALTEIVDR